MVPGPFADHDRLYNLGGTLNFSVSCGGGGVRPGDAILAEESGVLVLDPAEVEAIADEALARQARGLEQQAQVKAGKKLGELSGATAMVVAALKKQRLLVPAPTKRLSPKR